MVHTKRIKTPNIPYYASFHKKHLVYWSPYLNAHLHLQRSLHCTLHTAHCIGSHFSSTRSLLPSTMRKLQTMIRPPPLPQYACLSRAGYIHTSTEESYDSPHPQHDTALPYTIVYLTAEYVSARPISPSHYCSVEVRRINITFPEFDVSKQFLVQPDIIDVPIYLHSM
jgi:hypothetical protein